MDLSLAALSSLKSHFCGCERVAVDEHRKDPHRVYLQLQPPYYCSRILGFGIWYHSLYHTHVFWNTYSTSWLVCMYSKV